MRPWWSSLAALALGAAACTTAGTGDPPPDTSSTPTIAAPATPELADALGPMPADASPPVLADPDAAWAYPNQFWSSLNLAEGPSRLWLHPLTVEFHDEGLDIAAPEPVIEGAAMVAAYRLAVRVVIPSPELDLLGADAFSVTVELRSQTGTRFRTTLAEGHPLVTLTSGGGPLSVQLMSDATARADGEPLESSRVVDFTRRLDVEVDGQHWPLTTASPVRWQREGAILRTKLPPEGRLVLSAAPRDPVPGWDALLTDHAAFPVTGTSARGREDGAEAVQELRWARDGRRSYAVVLPHQVPTAVADGAPLAVLGRYPLPRGEALLVAADSLTWRSPLPAEPSEITPYPLSDFALSELDGAVAADSSRPIRAGGYFGSVDLAALALALDLLDAAGSDPTGPIAADTEGLRATLEAGVVDALVYDGESDVSWVGYEPNWGQLVIVPPEFGAESFNDRHFHVGHLLNAASTVARFRGRAALGGGADVADALASSLLGRVSGASDTPVVDADGWVTFGPGDILDPYLGHSLADGLAASNRGNNQESSSEAVSAWYAIRRWAGATGQPDLARAARIHQAVESAAAREYWFGLPFDTGGGPIPVAGIVWADRTEQRTFFSAEEFAWTGIRLVPVNLSGSHLDLVTGLAENARRLAHDGSNPWPDVFALILARSDPAEARTLLDDITVSGRETFHGLTATQRLLWPELMAALDPVGSGP
jgi:endo-1,3(4)-beta-glucanase